MEIVISVFAVAVAAGCLVALMLAHYRQDRAARRAMVKAGRDAS